MAKRKFINREEYEKIPPEGQIIFSGESPVSSIKLPPTKTAFFSLHKATVYGGRETCYVIRFDPKEAFSINVDAYSYTPDGREMTEISSAPIKDPEVFEQHKSDHLPEFLDAQAPDELKDKVTEWLGGCSGTK